MHVKRNRCASKALGNALIEYVVPATVLLMTAGVLLSATNVTSVIGGYFLAGSGHGASDVSGGVLKTAALQGIGFGLVGNGREGFADKFATLLDGNGEPLPTTAEGFFYNGIVVRMAERTPSSSPEYLYP
jgi:hypothetical protein